MPWPSEELQFCYVDPIRQQWRRVPADVFRKPRGENNNRNIDETTKLCRCDDCRSFVPFLVEVKENANRTQAIQQPDPAPIAAASPLPPAETIAPAPSEASTLVPLLPDDASSQSIY